MAQNHFFFVIIVSLGLTIWMVLLDICQLNSKGTKFVVLNYFFFIDDFEYINLDCQFK